MVRCCRAVVSEVRSIIFAEVFVFMLFEGWAAMFFGRIILRLGFPGPMRPRGSFARPFLAVGLQLRGSEIGCCLFSMNKIYYCLPGRVFSKASGIASREFRLVFWFDDPLFCR